MEKNCRVDLLLVKSRSRMLPPLVGLSVRCYDQVICLLGVVVLVVSPQPWAKPPLTTNLYWAH